MLTLRSKLIERKNATLELIKTLGNKDMPTQIEDGLLAAYCDIIQDIDTDLLATERQQLIAVAQKAFETGVDAMNESGATTRAMRKWDTYKNKTF